MRTALHSDIALLHKGAGDPEFAALAIRGLKGLTEDRDDLSSLIKYLGSAKVRREVAAAI